MHSYSLLRVVLEKVTFEQALYMILQVTSAAGGITVNIGSLASLSPIGPIRLGPSSTSVTPNTSVHTASEAGREHTERTHSSSVTIHGALISSGNANTALNSSNMSVSLPSTATVSTPASRSIVTPAVTSVSRGVTSSTATVLQLQGKQLLGARSASRTAGGGALTKLSSLLQGGTGTRIVTSSASSVLLTPSSLATSADTHQLKGKVRRPLRLKAFTRTVQDRLR